MGRKTIAQLEAELVRARESNKRLQKEKAAATRAVDVFGEENERLRGKMNEYRNLFHEVSLDAVKLEGEVQLLRDAAERGRNDSRRLAAFLTLAEAMR